MRQNLLIGAGLGLVAAVVFASATTGPFLARFVLIFITPLPLALAGLGWGPMSAVSAGVAGTLVVGLWAGGAVALAFAVSQAVPMAGLTYLALLARPVAVEGAGPPALEWYPPGRLVIWSALIAGVLSVIWLVLFGGDLAALKQSLADYFRTTVQDKMATMPDGTKLSDTDFQAMAEVMIALFPLALAISWVTGLLFNIWLGGRITLASGQLVRPWPDLSIIDFPKGSALIFAAALLGTLLDGVPGQVAKAFAGSFFVAFVLLGLAVIHYTTRGQPWRSFALWGLYITLFFLSAWVAVVIALIGLSEPIFKWRARYTPPPTPNTST
jgi:predicted membrane protein DUF2232